jgi:hypothetical protein
VSRRGPEGLDRRHDPTVRGAGLAPSGDQAPGQLAPPAIKNLTIVSLVAQIGRLCSISDNKLPIFEAGA